MYCKTMVRKGNLFEVESAAPFIKENGLLVRDNCIGRKKPHMFGFLG
jgi:hypothetical protein